MTGKSENLKVQKFQKLIFDNRRRGFEGLLIDSSDYDDRSLRCLSQSALNKNG